MTLKGWLYKQGSEGLRTWKKRWFVLSDRCLYYFQQTSENVPKGIIPLENVKVCLKMVMLCFSVSICNFCRFARLRTPSEILSVLKCIQNPALWSKLAKLIPRGLLFKGTTNLTSKKKKYKV